MDAITRVTQTESYLCVLFGQLCDQLRRLLHYFFLDLRPQVVTIKGATRARILFTLTWGGNCFLAQNIEIFAVFAHLPISFSLVLISNPLFNPYLS